MVDFIVAALFLALGNALVAEACSFFLARRRCSIVSHLKNIGRIWGVWLALQLVIALVLVAPMLAVQQSQSLFSALVLSLTGGVLILGLQRIWPYLIRVEQEPVLLGPGLDVRDGLPFWSHCLAGVILLLLCLPALLYAMHWPPWPNNSGVFGLAYALLAVCLHSFAQGRSSATIGIPSIAECPESGPINDALLDPDRQLQQALQHGHVALALSALEAGANAHQVPSGGKDRRSLLMMASTLGDVRLLRALIGAGVDINIMHTGMNALLCATRDSWHGRPEAVAMLLTNGAQTQITDLDGNTPLHHAMRSTDAAVAALLLDAGADIEAVNKDGFTPLALACRAANWRVARYMLERKAKVEPLNAEPVLIAAAGAEDDEAGIRLLHKHKAKLDVRGKQQRTALMAAAESGHADVLRVLLELGAALNLHDENGMSAYMYAAQAGEWEVLNALQALPKLSREARDAQGKSALDYALASGRWAVVALIDPHYPLPEHVKSSAQEENSGPSGIEQLLLALAQADFVRAEQLFLAGIRPSQHEWPNALLQCSLPEQQGALDWLLRHGGDLFIRDQEGVSVYQRLLERSNNPPLLIQYWLQSGQLLVGSGSLAIYIDICLHHDHSRRLDEQVALQLLQQGADPFSGYGTCPSPPLVLATRLGWQRLCQALLALGVDANARDTSGLSALHYAGQVSRGALLLDLLAYGANPAARASNGQTPLGLALMHGASSSIGWLQWPLWSVPGRKLYGFDLAAAVLANDIGAVEKLIELQVPVNDLDIKGSTALLHACGQGQMDTVRLLLRSGADASITARTGASALWAAISQEHVDILQVLLESGADANQYVAGYPPLHLACLGGRAELVSVLLAHGAISTLLDNQGHNALHALCDYLCSEKAQLDAVILVDTLVRAGVPFSAADTHRQTVLHILCGANLQRGQALKEGLVLSCLERLLQESPDVDGIDARGFTALHHASARGYAALAERLLHFGANKHLRDNLGRTAHDFAIMGGFSELANRLQDKPVRPDIASMLSQQHPD